MKPHLEHNITRLFVYGTLRKEFNNEMAVYLRENSSHLGLSRAKGYLFDVYGHYPGMVFDRTAVSMVYGDIFEVQKDKWEEVLKHIDEYEDYDPNDHSSSQFIRITMEAYSYGRTFKCWGYQYNFPIDDLTFIPFGDYVNYLERKKIEANQ